jgi:hypothetical protein
VQASVDTGIELRRRAPKLVVPLDPGLRPELFDVMADPGETRNLATAHPDIVTGLRELGQRELAARRQADLGKGATQLEWNHITKLRSLGYLQ